MSLVELPSGLRVTLHEPSYGEVVDLVLHAPTQSGEMLKAKCDLIVCGLSRREIAALSMADGRVLTAAVGALWDEVTSAD